MDNYKFGFFGGSKRQMQCQRHFEMNFISESWDENRSRHTIILVVWLLALLCSFPPTVVAGYPESRKGFDNKDINRDGHLDPSEYTAVYQERFKRLDRDGDGLLTQGDFESFGLLSIFLVGLESFKPEDKGKIIQKYKRMDTNQNEQVSLHEFLSYQRQRIAAMDSDKDTHITWDEYQASKRNKK